MARRDSSSPIFVVSREMLGKWFTICSPSRNSLGGGVGVAEVWPSLTNLLVVDVLAGLSPLQSEGGG